MDKVLKVWGGYTKFGYTIYGLTESGAIDEIYRAGNNRHESADTATVPPGHPAAVSLARLAKYCEQTGREIAAELQAEWLGCYHDIDAEREREALRE